MKGKVALISGGARGQGASHAELIAEEGGSVIIGDVLDEEGRATADALRDRGLAVECVHLDVTSKSDWLEAVSACEAKFGKVNVLVNNAGVVAYSGIVECSEDEWSRTIAVNQGGVYLGMHTVIPAMRRAGGGSIVNISSIFGLNGAPEYVSYITSKAAVIGLTKNAAVTYGHENIRVNAIAPGSVDTPMLWQEIEDAGGADVDRLTASTPIKRIAKPREISYGVLYLASDEASYVTGITLVIDGGYSAT
jgi:NAD(P)-dependent dehydrogenase (short-subunit alcohol dehydrogenase family)